MATAERIQPVYFRNKEIFPGFVRIELLLTSWEVCESVANVTGPDNVEGAMVIRGIWRIYTASADARVKLLTTGLSLRHKSVTLLDETPTSKNMKDKPETEKITVSNLPLKVDNDDIKTFPTSYSKVKLVSDIKYGNCRTPSGDMTSCNNGTRYCYAECPVGNIPRKQ